MKTLVSAPSGVASVGWCRSFAGTREPWPCTRQRQGRASRYRHDTGVLRQRRQLVCRIDSVRSAIVLWLVVRARAVEEGRPYPGPHALDVRSGIGCGGEAVVVLQADGFVLRQPTLATPTELLPFRQLEESGPHPFMRMVNALLLQDFCPGAVRLKVNNGLVGLGVAISDQTGVHEAEGKRSTPQTLCCFHLHGVGTARVVDGAVLLMHCIPCIEGVWLVTELCGSRWRAQRSL